MAANTTVEDAANMALDILTEGAIKSLDEDRKPARILKRHFETVRETELKAHAWHFAIIRADADPVDTAIEGPNQYRFAVPDDALRVLPLMSLGYPDGFSIPFKEMGGALYSSYSSTVPIIYIGNIVDPAEWDSNFLSVFAAALAVKSAHAITQKTTMVKFAMDIYDMEVKKARKANAIMQGFQVPPETFGEARGDTSYATQRWRG